MAQVTVTSSATTLDAAASTRAVIVDNRGPAPITLSTGVVVLPFKSRQVSVTSGTPLTATCGTGLTSIVNVDDQPVSSGGGGGGGGSTVTVDSTGQIVVNGTATNLATDAEVAALLAALPGTYAPLLAGVTYDIIVAAGQSNMSGRATADTTRYETVHPQVFTYDTAGSYPNAITQAVVPLGHADRVTLSNTLGPDFGFAKLYADTVAAGRRVLVVPVAYGGTGFSSSAGTSGVTLQWDPAGSGNLYTQAIAQANAAVAAVTAAGGTARIAAILWLQGEYDAAAVGYSAATYQAKLDALIAGFRAGITGASASTPFVVGQMAPGFITTTGPAATAINAVHSGTPLRVGYTAFAAGVSGQDDNLHYNATGQRAMSRSMFAAFRSAGPLVAAVPGQVTGLTATRGVGQVQLAWTPVMAYPAVTDYSVQKSTDGGTTWTTVTHTASTANTITVTGLTNGTAVTFQVAAVNASGTGAYSSTVTATPAAGVFSDTFTRADNASSLGTTTTGSKTWTALSGTWGIASNQAYCSAGAASTNEVAIVDAGAADGTLAVTLGSGSILGNAGVVFRATDDSNHLLVTGSGDLYRKQSGTYTKIAGAAIPLSPGDAISVVLSGSSITCKLNGATWCTATDAFNQTATKHGLRSYNNDTTARFAGISLI